MKESCNKCNMLLGKLVKLYRESRNMSLREMEKVIGVESTALFRFESGKPVSNKNWVRIVKWVLTE